MKHDHKLTYITIYPQAIEPEPRRQWLSEVCAALTFAGLIALPFVLYFALYMKP